MYNGIGVYILRCANGRYYVGSTDNIERRFGEHCRGLVKATRNVLPVDRVFFQKFETLTQARKMEYLLKAKKSRKILEQIISEGYIRAASSVG